MARFFKLIFHVLLIGYIAVILALVVPPLVGFTTATTLENTEGNQSVGTVDYAKRVALEELQVGEKILVTGNNSVNVYTVQSVNTENSTVTVADTENQEVPVRSYVYRLVMAVPFIGYVIIALQSMEGIIVLAMIAVLLILLCILTSIWTKKMKEKRKRRKELEAERIAAEKRSAEQAAEEAARAERAAEESSRAASNARAEAYFAARQAEKNRPAPIEEYEDFPPKPVAKAVPEKAAFVPAAALVPKPVAVPESEMDYFDDDEDNEDVDSWLHDDVDDDDLYEGLNNRAASESLMATARLFAINRAAQVKERMSLENESAEGTDQTKVVAPEEVAALKAQAAAATVKGKATGQKIRTEVTASAAQKGKAVKEIVVDKVVNLSDLNDLDDDTQQIVLTINIKVRPE